MEEPLLRPRPAVEAFFDVFEEKLDEHFSDEKDIPPKNASNLLSHYIGLETSLHSNSDGMPAETATEITRKDVRLMMAVYLWEVYFLKTNGIDDDPVMAAYDFVMSNEFFIWAQSQPTPINLMKQGEIFDAVWKQVEKLDFGSYLGSINPGYQNNDSRLVDFSDAYQRVMAMDRVGAGDSGSSDIIPFESPDRIPVAQLIGRPRSIRSQSVVQYILGAAAVSFLYGAQAVVNNARRSGDLPRDISTIDANILARRLARSAYLDWTNELRGNITATPERLVRRAERVGLPPASQRRAIEPGLADNTPPPDARPGLSLAETNERRGAEGEDEQEIQIDLSPLRRAGPINRAEDTVDYNQIATNEIRRRIGVVGDTVALPFTYGLNLARVPLDVSTGIFDNFANAVLPLTDEFSSFPAASFNQYGNSANDFSRLVFDQDLRVDPNPSFEPIAVTSTESDPTPAGFNSSDPQPSYYVRDALEASPGPQPLSPEAAGIINQFANQSPLGQQAYFNASSGPGVTPAPGIGFTGSNLDSPPSRRRKFAFKL